jgi:microcin C transport system substrate-binding protein
MLYIEYTFYNQYPTIPRGFYLNVSKPLLDNQDIRIGIQHAM